METILKYLKSRLVWTGVITALIAGGEAYLNGASYRTAILAVLSAAIIYFRKTTTTVLVLGALVFGGNYSCAAIPAAIPAVVTGLETVAQILAYIEQVINPDYAKVVETCNTAYRDRSLDLDTQRVIVAGCDDTADAYDMVDLEYGSLLAGGKDLGAARDAVKNYQASSELTKKVLRSEGYRVE